MRDSLAAVRVNYFSEELHPHDGKGVVEDDQCQPQTENTQRFIPALYVNIVGYGSGGKVVTLPSSGRVQTWCPTRCDTSALS